MMFKHFSLQKAIVIVIAVAALGTAGWFVYHWNQDRTISVVAMQPIVREDLNLTFTYPSGQNGYSLIEPPIPEATSALGLEAAFLLLPTPQYITYQQQNNEGVPPPALSVFVYAAPEPAEGDERSNNELLLDWAKSNKSLTGLDESLIPGVSATKVDGVNAYQFSTEGIYQQHTYLMYYRGRYYVFAGQYEVVGDEQEHVFNDLIDSVVFQ